MPNNVPSIFQRIKISTHAGKGRVDIVLIWREIVWERSGLALSEIYTGRVPIVRSK